MREHIGVRLFGLLLLVATATAQAHDRDALRVMTQNLYIGADVTNIVNTADFTQLPAVVHQVFATVGASDFPARARAFAEQVKDARPDVIGLQEVSLIRVQEQSDFFQGNPQPATEVKADYLQIVLHALAARGLHYKVAGVVDDIDQELPAFGDLDGDGVPGLYDLRLTDRDVILVRSRIEVSNVTPYNYAASIYYPTPAGDITYTRGAIAVDAQVRGQSYRLVNTHLEVRYDDNVAVIQALQMQELLGMVRDETRRLVLMGDLNASPENTPDTYWGLPTPYQQAQLAGLSDIWLSGGKGDGYTCCHSELLNDLDEPQTQRIDYIFVKNAVDEMPFSQVGKARAYTFSEVTGNDTWYSDHDGVFARIRFTPERRHERHRDDEDGERGGHGHRHHQERQRR
jgi:endonuclease/exonuclease/phosphatase family metal-dependent hydrolase